MQKQNKMNVMNNEIFDSLKKASMLISCACSWIPSACNWTEEANKWLANAKKLYEKTDSEIWYNCDTKISPDGLWVLVTDGYTYALAYRESDGTWFEADSALEAQEFDGDIQNQKGLLSFEPQRWCHIPDQGRVR